MPISPFILGPRKSVEVSLSVSETLRMECGGWDAFYFSETYGYEFLTPFHSLNPISVGSVGAFFFILTKLLPLADFDEGGNTGALSQARVNPSS